MSTPDAGRIDLVDDPRAPSDDRDARIAGDGLLHPGADERRLGTDQRHRLALHVRPHQSAVCVVVLQERDQRRRNRNQLLGRDIDQVDLLRPGHDEISALAAIRQIGRYSAFCIDFDIGLRDGVAPLVHRRQVDDLVGYPAVHDPAVGAFDEPVLIDAGISRQAVDQADIRAFRGLDRADPAVMSRVHVAYFEAGALAGQPAGAERRQAPLVGNLRQRVCLVHELRQLRGTEELAHRSRRRFCIDQVVRHDGVDLDRAHALADRPLHAQQSDAILVFHQLADRADPAVAEMIDVVDLAAAVF
jgi:hypothetical protein